MLISRTHRFVFVHVGKNGGNAIAHALGSFSSPGYWSGDSEQKHWPAFKIKKEILLHAWGDFFSFAVVSNPWRWLHSSFHYIKMTALLYSQQTLSPELAAWRQWTVAEPDEYTRRWLAEVDRTARKGFEEFVRDECADFLDRFPGGQIRKWCQDLDGLPLVSRIVSYERLAAEWPVLCQQLGVGAIGLERLNPTILPDGRPRSTRPYQVDYSPAMRDAVREAFALDIDVMDYKFDK